MNVVYETNCPTLKLLGRGKVRDIYDLGQYLLLVATDRLSAFDVVSADPIPEKGRVLTEMSVFWFGWLKRTLPWLKTHFLTADGQEIIKLQPDVVPYAGQLAGRSMLVYKVDRIIPVEAVVRLFLYGSGWSDYQKTGAVCGVELPPGMKKADALPMPMFTPATKEEQRQHDENVSVQEALNRGLITPLELSAVAATASLVLFLANEYAKTKGILIPDTKFEFGMLDGELVLADEVLTPDSSRFWPADQYKPGGDQPSLDKQFVREWLEKEVEAGRWNKTAPMPRLSRDIIIGTTERYLEALKRLTS
ncbi:MAG: phosphoribosylaminoimidazolesuccinocarboxamide synthase [Patescibacteria group bacterium]